VHLLDQPLDPAGVIREVERYDPEDAARVSLYIRQQANLSVMLDCYLRLYDELMACPLPSRRTFCSELNEYLLDSVGRMAHLELELARYRYPDRMGGLSDSTCSQLTLAFDEPPDAAVCGDAAQVSVVLENHSTERIGTFPPFPVHLSYRWFSETSGDMVVAEGLRTPLHPPLLPSEKRKYAVRVNAPDEPGRYRLRVTLVQELVRWLDEPARLLCAETSVVVVSALPVSRPA
jgi:hypothetical protein